ncbi:DgyrCDS3669 [Dimorphilus gyrociliatus]|uniref:DgyrCDS3669 n=1 Tax=Dimorphilus gyrociliatus TaxID=2664684 RepID=A0A7I8VFY4_9ANNE|nr:DgyrCDS3669 [Dimorphilus gyrociliatus]
MASSFSNFFSRDKTFKQKKKNIIEGTLRYDLHKRANASLNQGFNLRSVVKLPDSEDLNDWIAVHVVDFFNRINVIYGIVNEYCTPETCPTMSGGQKYEYKWCDGVKYKKPTSLPAPTYISYLMDWVESQINNENIFPVEVGVAFPKNYNSIVKKILTRLFRVFVHVYIHHFDVLTDMGAEPHINTCYKHFYYFVAEFNLVEKKELEPLKELTCRICS